MEDISFSQQLEALTAEFVGTVWGLPLVGLLVGAGFIFTLYFGFPQLSLFKHAIDIVRGKYDNPDDEGEISHFQALTTALSATVGLGNIAGVAVAVAVGGPGAVFWLWIAGFLGMTTKFTEVTLALKYRYKSAETGSVHGGPMFVLRTALREKYLSSGNIPLGKLFGALAWLYAFFVILSSFGAGNMFQSNQMASIINLSTGIPEWVSGLVFAVLAFIVLIGGIKRIAQVTEKLVPAMVVLYVGGALTVVIANFAEIPNMFNMIFSSAFAGTAATGGFAGVVVKEVIVQGIRRASFSSEAGMGSAAMAHSAAKSDPIQEGIVALLEPFIDTILVCTITALALLSSGVWSDGDVQGVDLTARAFATVMGPAGKYLVALTVTMFAFSTLISWSYYGEQGVTYVFGEKGIKPYRYLFVIFVFLGAIAKLSVVLNISDGVYGLLAIPNMIACFLLMPVVKKTLKEYKHKLSTGVIKRID
ncbi:MAG: alanine glycine permease [Halobacteriovoraceae bacterium]|nr:alanine glycine permease [Halobacteriovoraceae bacterium]|tara:strand:- start:2730 stop:4154 length:1425 start_codon:yes stop_codon:yes gene_type:complete